MKKGEHMDTAQIITTSITTAGLIVVAYINYKTGTKVEKYHKEVNGKMGQLLEVTKKSSKAEGKLEGEKEAKEHKG